MLADFDRKGEKCVQFEGDSKSEFCKFLSQVDEAQFDF